MHECKRDVWSQTVHQPTVPTATTTTTCSLKAGAREGMDAEGMRDRRLRICPYRPTAMGRMIPGSADRQQRHSRSSYDLAVRHWWAGAWVQKGHVIADAESAHEKLGLPCTIMVRNISKGRACGRSSGGRLTLHASGVLRFRECGLSGRLPDCRVMKWRGVRQEGNSRRR